MESEKYFASPRDSIDEEDLKNEKLEEFSMNGLEEPNVLNKHPVSTDVLNKRPVSTDEERQMLEEEWIKDISETDYDSESLASIVSDKVLVSVCSEQGAAEDRVGLVNGEDTSAEKRLDELDVKLCECQQVCETLIPGLKLLN